MKVALYARYSTDNQRDASIADQIRVCRAYAEKQGWRIVEEYSDHAISGASLLRAGVQALIADALRGRFQIVLAEAMDRLSRDQEDIAGLFKRMVHANVKIITLSEGEVTHLHVGLKGTMNALFLKDLADKTRRGLRGRVELGKSGGGNSYGYDVVKQFQTNGEPIRGDRTVNAAEAEVVRRIFHDYVVGRSQAAFAITVRQGGQVSVVLLAHYRTSAGQAGDHSALKVYSIALSLLALMIIVTGLSARNLKNLNNEVMAQTGKLLTPAQANQLIAGANQLRTTLGC